MAQFKTQKFTFFASNTVIFCEKNLHFAHFVGWVCNNKEAGDREFGCSEAPPLIPSEGEEPADVNTTKETVDGNWSIV